MLQGLAENISNPQGILKEILAWTNGQPFLTQKICKLIRQNSSPLPEKNEAEWIENLIHTHIINNWELQDEPEHLRTIRDRILKSQQSAQLLQLYHRILRNEEEVSPDSPVEQELRLSGLVIKQDEVLRVSNRIYRLIFNNHWVKQHSS